MNWLLVVLAGLLDDLLRELRAAWSEACRPWEAFADELRWRERMGWPA